MNFKENDNPYGNTLFSKSTRKSHDIKPFNNSNYYHTETQSVSIVPKVEDSSKLQNNRYSNKESLQNMNKNDFNHSSLNENNHSNINDHYGFIHDKYLISSEINPMNSRLSTFNKSILNPDTAHKFDSR